MCIAYVCVLRHVCVCSVPYTYVFTSVDRRINIPHHHYSYRVHNNIEMLAERVEPWRPRGIVVPVCRHYVVYCVLCMCVVCGVMHYYGGTYSISNCSMCIIK